MKIQVNKQDKKDLKKILTDLRSELDSITALAEKYNSKVKLLNAKKQLILAAILEQNNADKSLNWKLDEEFNLEGFEKSYEAVIEEVKEEV